MPDSLLGKIFCWLGIHDFHIIRESFSFGGGGMFLDIHHLLPRYTISILVAPFAKPLRKIKVGGVNNFI